MGNYPILIKSKSSRNPNLPLSLFHLKTSCEKTQSKQESKGKEKEKRKEQAMKQRKERKKSILSEDYDEGVEKKVHLTTDGQYF